MGMALLLGISADAAMTFTDDFNDGAKASFWNVPTLGSGASIAEANGRLEITIATDASGSQFSAAYQSVGLFNGDFDEQVEYCLLEWPSQSGVRVGIGLSLIAAMERVSFGVRDVGSGELYVTGFQDGFFAVPTGDRAGKLRLTKTGGMLSGYYWDGNGWALIHTGPCLPGEAKLSLGVWSHDQYFGHRRVQAAFDNYQVTYDESSVVGVVPEPSTVVAGMLLLTPFASLGVRRLWHSRQGR